MSDRLTAQAGQLAPGTDASCRYTAPPDDWDWLATVAAAVGVPYRVEAPPELVAATRRLAERAQAAT